MQEDHKLFIFSRRRRRRSGWSGLGRTTFQRVVRLVPRLQRRSEVETIEPSVPRKLAFAVRVRVSRNRSRSFTGGSGARRGPTGLHRHPRVAKYACVYDMQLLAIWRIPLVAVVLFFLPFFLFSFSFFFYLFIFFWYSGKYK